MAARKTLRTELDELRKELDDLRKEKAAGPAQDKADAKPRASGDAKKDKSIEDLINDVKSDTGTVLKDIAKLGEKEIERNPLLAIGLAFLVGLLIGRSSRF
ncbi:MAG: hypothetical protein AAF362_03455 [Pseudomonadota bacterium]